MRKSFEKFLERQDALARQYGKEYEDKQHNRGKLTARERLTHLLRRLLLVKQYVHTGMG